MNRRRRTVVAAVVTVIAALVLPVSQAGLAEAAGEPQVSITPATGVKDGQQVSVTLTGAADYEGMAVGFAECLANDDYASGGCTNINPDTVISGGSASGTVTALVGPMPHNPGLSCTVANNGSCAIRAFVFMNGGTNMVAMTPISFADSVATITATPSTDLDHGDQVAVSVSDIAPTAGTTISILECNTDAAAALGSYLTGACKELKRGTSANRAYSTTVNIVDGALNGSVDCDEETPIGHCVIAAVDHANQKLLATTPITFEPQQLSVSVTPTTGLKNRQQVPVTITGISSRVTSLYVLQCNTTWTAEHGYDANLVGCTHANAVSVSHHAVSTTVTITDGKLNQDADAPSCSFASNGECGIVLLSSSYDPESGTTLQQVGTPVPIAFRTPITGMTTIEVSPTTGLHNEAPVTVSVPAGTIADGVDAVQFLECNMADLEKKGGNTDPTCFNALEVDVTDNSIPDQQVPIREGQVGEMGKSHCDNTHDCSVAMFSWVPASGEITRLSNWVPLSFRDPNILGTPVIKAKPLTGLSAGQKVKVTIKKIPDLTRYVSVLECNVSVPKRQWAYGEMPCINVSGMNPLMVHDNAASKSVKVRPAMVGYRKGPNGDKKVFCNASTNGDCALVAYQSDPYTGAPVGVLARSERMSFAP